MSSVLIMVGKNFETPDSRQGVYRRNSKLVYPLWELPNCRKRIGRPRCSVGACLPSGRDSPASSARNGLLFALTPCIPGLLGNIQGQTEVIHNPPSWSGNPLTGHLLHQGA